MKFKAISTVVLALFAGLWWHRHTTEPSEKNLTNKRKIERRPAAEAKPTSSLDSHEKVRAESIKNIDGNSLVGDVRKELKHYQDCLNGEKCDVEDSDSRAVELNAGQSLRRQLENLNRDVLKNNYRSRELVELAQELLGLDDGFIKEEALKLMLSQEPQPENVSVIAKTVFEYHDSNLVDAALSELQRHLAGAEAQDVHWTIRQCLLTGSLLVRESLSEKMGPFINAGSHQFYLDLNRDASLDLPVRRNLSSLLEEWELQERGG